MADNKELAALVAKWREQANAAARWTGRWNGNDLADRIEWMADELESALTATPSAQAGEARGKWTPEQINELLENMDRWKLVLGKRKERVGDRWDWSVSDAADLIRTLLATPQPQGDASDYVEVLRRLEDALPTVGLNGWTKGVEAVRYAIAALSTPRTDEPAVFLREPASRGTVGEPLPHGYVDMPLRVSLRFPTAEQAEAVANALVNAQPHEPAPTVDGGADLQMPGDVWRNSDGTPTNIPHPAPAPDVALRGALLWALYHHQGSSSVVGQPVRRALGMSQHENMTAEQISEAKRFAQPEPPQ